MTEKQAHTEAEFEDIGAQAYEDADLETSDLPSGYKRKDGKIWITRKSGREEKAEYRDIWICQDFRVTALTRDVDGGAWSSEIVFKDHDGKDVAILVPHGSLLSDASKVMKLLADEGFEFSPKKRDKDDLIVLLAAYKVAQRVTTCERPGLYGRGSDRAAHVTPTGEVIRCEGAPEGESMRLLRPVDDCSKRGDLETWKDGAARVMSHRDLPHVAIGILTGPAGTIIDWANLESRSLNFAGASGTGKSTAQVYGGSWWGNPDPDQGGGVVISAKGTTNALEYQFPKSTGASLHLDEGANSDPKTMAKIGFAFAAGAGKKRMTSELKERTAPVWRGFLTTSSEIDLATLAKMARELRVTGAVVRMVTVSVDGVSQIDPAEAKRIKQIAMDNYGHAGPAFVAELFRRGYHRDPSDLTAMVAALRDELVTESGRGSKASVFRAAETFAILWAVGRIGVEAGILPASHDDVRRVVLWGWQSFLASDDARPLNGAAAAIEQLITTLKTTPAHVRKVNDDYSNQEIWAWYNDEHVYLPVDHLSKFNLPVGRDELLKVLDEQQLLLWQGRNRIHPHIPGIGEMKHYRLKVQIREPAAKTAADAAEEAKANGADPDVARAAATFEFFRHGDAVH